MAFQDGRASGSIQVKTTASALRKGGRGKARKPDHYEWDVGKKLATQARPELLFAFVDLKGMKTTLDLLALVTVPSTPFPIDGSQDATTPVVCGEDRPGARAAAS